MGAMRKMAVYLGLVEDELDGYVEEPEDYESNSRSARPEPVRAGAGRREEPTASYAAVREVRPAAVPVRSSRPATPSRLDLRDPDPAPFDETGGDSYRITTLHPRSYNDARRIGEEFRLGTPVIMNLTEMDDDDAKRIIDFAAGLIFGLHGSIERVTNKVFLLSPANVDVAAEARRLAQDGFFNQS